MRRAVLARPPLLRAVLCAVPLPALLACAPAEGFTLPLLGPYREPVDQCRGVADGPDTTPLMRPGYDLVACPADYDGLQIFVMDVDAAELRRIGDWILYEVPQPI